MAVSAKRQFLRALGFEIGDRGRFSKDHDQALIDLSEEYEKFLTDNNFDAELPVETQEHIDPEQTEKFSSRQVWHIPFNSITWNESLHNADGPFSVTGHNYVHFLNYAKPGDLGILSVKDEGSARVFCGVILIKAKPYEGVPGTIWEVREGACTSDNTNHEECTDPKVYAQKHGYVYRASCELLALLTPEYGVTFEELKADAEANGRGRKSWLSQFQRTCRYLKPQTQIVAVEDVLFILSRIAPQLTDLVKNEVNLSEFIQGETADEDYDDEVFTDEETEVVDDPKAPTTSLISSSYFPPSSSPGNSPRQGLPYHLSLMEYGRLKYKIDKDKTVPFSLNGD